MVLVCLLVVLLLVSFVCHNFSDSGPVAPTSMFVGGKKRLYVAHADTSQVLHFQAHTVTPGWLGLDDLDSSEEAWICLKFFS